VSTDIWERLTSFANLHRAYCLAKKGKSRKADIVQFGFELEHELLVLQQSLRNFSYEPGPYRQFQIYERKPRVISVAPFRDRVVHHALMQELQPVMDVLMHPHSYACRPGKGVHKAVDYYQLQACRYAYVLKVDIKSYFASIRHDVLFQQLSEVFRNEQFQWLMRRLLCSSGENGVGLPIGNLTSQWFANWYLNAFDYQLSLKVAAYFRYVDDIYLFADQKRILWDSLALMNVSLATLGLTIHPSKIQLRRTSEKVDVLGYQVSRHRRWLRNENGQRFVRRLKLLKKAVGRGQLTFEQAKPSIMSWIGHAQHAETYGLRCKIFSENKF
jgi:RNA-directed DNA polymerase